MIHSHIGQGPATTLPPEVLEALGLLPGDEVVLGIVDGTVVIRPADDDLDENQGYCDEEIRQLIAEADDGQPLLTADEVFGQIHAMLDERRRRSDA